MCKIETNGQYKIEIRIIIVAFAIQLQLQRFLCTFLLPFIKKLLYTAAKNYVTYVHQLRCVNFVIIWSKYLKKKRKEKQCL